MTDAPSAASDLPTAVRDAMNRVGRDFPATRHGLEELIRIPSCSFPGSDPGDLQRAAAATADWARRIGMPEVEVVAGPWPPYVLARDHRAGPERPTVLLYSHYDVQPPLREALWESPPYEPTERHGRLYGRGSADDKAGIAASLGACAAWLSDHEHLPCNVTIWVEGEEEIGSPHLGDFLATHGERLACDAIVIADVGNVATGIPSLTTSLRGMVALEVELTALRNPLHSGMWGGPAPDPVHALCKLLGQLADDRSRPILPGLAIPEPDPRLLADLGRIPYDAAGMAASMGLAPDAAHLLTDGAETMRRTWYEPAFSINAIHAGGPPGQAGNVIMDKAWARISVRTVAGMSARAVGDALEARIRDLVPPHMTVAVEREAEAEAWTTATDHPIFDACRSAFAAGYGRETVAIGCGGTIPFVGVLSDRLGGVPALLVPVEDPDTRPHAENESVHLGDLQRTTASLAALLGLI